MLTGTTKYGFNHSKQAERTPKNQTAGQGITDCWSR